MVGAFKRHLETNDEFAEMARRRTKLDDSIIMRAVNSAVYNHRMLQSHEDLFSDCSDYSEYAGALRKFINRIKPLDEANDKRYSKSLKLYLEFVAERSADVSGAKSGKSHVAKTVKDPQPQSKSEEQKPSPVAVCESAPKHTAPMEPIARDLFEGQEDGGDEPSSVCEENLVKILAEFPNGVRPRDFIDQRKIRNRYRERFGSELLEDFDFAGILPQIGIVSEGKVFPHPSSEECGWRKLLDDLVAHGHTCFRFSNVMKLHVQELMRLGVASEGMLRELVVTEASDAFDVHDDFFLVKGLVFPEVIGQEDFFVSEESLVNAFPYVGIDYIHKLLSRDQRLLRNSLGNYVVFDRIVFDDDEVTTGKRECETAVKEEGSYSLTRLPLANSAAMNDKRLADSVLRKAFFRRFLQEDFALNGNFVCDKHADVDSRSLLRAFCRTHPEVSLEQIDVIAKESNLDKWFALATVHKEMVRVDRNRFVPPDHVAFDVEEVDNAISVRCNGKATPFGVFLRGFADFPAVPGFLWNEFLLESFLRRCSGRFRLFWRSTAEEPAGVVAEKDAFQTYQTAFATAAIEAGVAMEEKAVGDFLFSSRCVLRRGAKLVESVVAAMRTFERDRK